MAKTSDLREFASLSTGGSGLFTVTEDASPELRELAELFPGYLTRALRHLAWRIQQEIAASIRAGRVDGARWPERSRMHIYRRMDYLRAGRYDKLTLKGELGYRRYRMRAVDLARIGNIRGRFSHYSKARGEWTTYSRKGERLEEGQSIPKAFERWVAYGGSKGMRASGAMQGRLASGLLYKEITPTEFDVGARNSRVANLLTVAQQGRTQAITQKMRRAFWAAGIPLRKGKTTLSTPERDLIGAVFRRMEPYFEDIVLTRLNSYIAGKSGETAGVFRLPWR